MTNRIYAYYAEVGCAGQLELIEFWKERWAHEGWQPIILTEDDANRDSRYDALQEKVRNLPCRPGAKSFERSNFERWLAFAQIDGAVTDYDVFPRVPFHPRDFGQFVCGDGAGGPGFIAGEAGDFSGIVELILNYELKEDDVFEGAPHLCDMRVLQRNRHMYDRLLHNISCYGEDGWLEKPLTHFGNASLDAHTDCFAKMTKTEAVRELIAKHYVA